MSIVYLVIIAILAFIAYQLYQSNELKKLEFENRELEKEEERITAFMPHLYNKTTSEKGKEELKKFFYENEDWYENEIDNPYAISEDIDSQPPRQRKFAIMKVMTKDENDKEKKEKMEKALERMKKVTKELVEQLGKRETTLTEREFVLWHYYENEYNNFPEIEGISDDLIISSYLVNFPEKNSMD